MENIKKTTEKKVQYLNDIYELAISQISETLLEIVGLEKDELIKDASYNSLINVYKMMFYKLKLLDKEVKNIYCFEEEYKVLKFNLKTIFKGIRNILEEDFNINQINVDLETDEWTIIK